MKSHVQIPKSILKNFAYRSQDDGLVVDYLDLNDNTIKTEKIKKLDTIENYYSEECEIFLSENIESPFAEISKKIKSFGSGKLKNLTLVASEIKIIFDFYNYTFSRSRYAVLQANLNCMASVVQPVTNEELIQLQRHNIFNEYCVRILRNRTDTNFLIPRNCFYIKTSSVSKNPYIILPFSKKTALVLLSKEEDIATRQYYNEYLFVDSDKRVKILNEKALNFEILMNNEFIVGQLSELKRIRKINSKYLRKNRINKFKKILQTIFSKIFNLFSCHFKKKIR